VKRLLALTALGVMLPIGAVHAQTSPPTTIDVETSTVERTVTTLDVKQVDTDDDDDSDKTGLWGLLGLLGLAGLAGLRKRRDDTTDTTGTVSGDTTPRGSTGTRP
jgi:MYXO-CTERM domain-containing protein